jgi:hypothetical protein
VIRTLARSSAPRRVRARLGWRSWSRADRRPHRFPRPWWRMHGASRRKNASGDAELRRGVASGARKVCSARIAAARDLGAYDVPLVHHSADARPPRNAGSLVLPPAVRPAAGRASRAQNPAVAQTARTIGWDGLVNASLPCQPQPEQRPVNRSRPARRKRGRMPNKPESRRNRREAATVTMPGAMRGRIHPSPAAKRAGSARTDADGMPKEPESRRNPGELGTIIQQTNLINPGLDR